MLAVGDRVYYKDNDPEDTGTVTFVREDVPNPYRVMFDRDNTNGPVAGDWYAESQLVKI